MQTVSEKKFFCFERVGETTGRVSFDYPGEKINKLSSAVFSELENLLKELSGYPELKTLIFCSSKKDCFIAGADIDEIKQIDLLNIGREMSGRAQHIFNILEHSPFTTIALIDGACLGGGLEFALACDYRIASDNPKTILGFPEVKIGLIPGAGGTQRLPRLIGLQQSVEIILSGKNIRPAKALKIGLIDELVPNELIMAIALKRAEEFSGKGKAINHQRKKEVKDWLLEETKLGKNLIFKKAGENLRKTVGNKYPAPFKALELLKETADSGFSDGLKLEANAFGELCETQVSKNLIHLFELTSKLKKSEKSKKKLPEIKKIGLIGSGLMGAGIAKVILDLDLPVRMNDLTPDAIGKGLKNISDYFQKKVEKKQLSEVQAQMKMDKISGTTDFSGFKQVDLVIEAVFEDLSLKQKLFSELEKVVSAKCIFATNTSALPVGEIASGLKHPERVIGMHFFSPVEKMPLLEIVKTEKTADWVTETIKKFGIELGKNVIIVNDGPGFYTTRALAAYLNEALNILLEGGDILQIDQVMEDFGFPVGPFKLLDEVGIDVGTKVVKVLAENFSRIKSHDGLTVLITNKRLGKKNKKGFYNYRSATVEVDSDVYQELGLQSRRAFTSQEIKNRLVYTFLNEAVFCREENILTSIEDGDAGAVFGLGFPPFLGGPFKYIDSIGCQQVLVILQDLQEKYGERFAPAETIRKFAETASTFYQL